MAKKHLGYFSYNHANMPGKQDFFGQLWKEYSFSDSRYLTSDPFVLCMETVTAVRTIRVLPRYQRKNHRLKASRTNNITNSSPGAPFPSS